VKAFVSASTIRHHRYIIHRYEVFGPNDPGSVHSFHTDGR